MGSWRKLLVAMAADTDPRGYTYDEAAGILKNLGFSTPQKSGSSHKVWRLALPDGDKERTVRVELVDAGKGKVKPAYIRKMVKILRENHLLADEV